MMQAWKKPPTEMQRFAALSHVYQEMYCLMQMDINYMHPEQLWK